MDGGLQDVECFVNTVQPREDLAEIDGDVNIAAGNPPGLAIFSDGVLKAAPGSEGISHIEMQERVVRLELIGMAERLQRVAISPDFGIGLTQTDAGLKVTRIFGGDVLPE